MDPYVSIIVDPAQGQYLTLNGVLPLYVPMQGYKGTEIRPSFSFRDFERSGFYAENYQHVKLSVNGFESYRFGTGSLGLVNKSRQTASLVLPSLSGDITLTLPSESGTLALEGSTGGGGGNPSLNSYSETFGDGSNNFFTITHNLNSHNLLISLYGIPDTWKSIQFQAFQNTTNTLEVYPSDFYDTPNSYHIVILAV